MAHARPEMALRYLPRPGDAIFAVPRNGTWPGRVFWLIDQRTWQAPLLPCGLVAWSKAEPARGEETASLTAPLRALEQDNRIDSDQLPSPDVLPQSGQPLLLDAAVRRGFWKHGGQLMTSPWSEGLLIWTDVSAVHPAEAAPQQRPVLAHAARTLREATPQITTTLNIPFRDRRARDIIIANRWIETAVRPKGIAGPRLCLRTRDAYRLHIGDAALLDRAMAEHLATELTAYPGTHDKDTSAVPVTHAQPTATDGLVTIWRVAEGLEVQHDLRQSPLTLWLRSQEDHNLTDEHAAGLASALVAGVELLDRVQYLAVTAVHHDHPRYAAVRAEAAFIAQLTAPRHAR